MRCVFSFVFVPLAMVMALFLGSTAAFANGGPNKVDVHQGKGYQVISQKSSSGTTLIVQNQYGQKIVHSTPTVVNIIVQGKPGKKDDDDRDHRDHDHAKPTPSSVSQAVASTPSSATNATSDSPPAGGNAIVSTPVSPSSSGGGSTRSCPVPEADLAVALLTPAQLDAIGYDAHLMEDCFSQALLRPYYNDLAQQLLDSMHKAAPPTNVVYVPQYVYLPAPAPEMAAPADDAGTASAAAEVSCGDSCSDLDGSDDQQAATDMVTPAAEDADQSTECVVP